MDTGPNCTLKSTGVKTGAIAGVTSGGVAWASFDNAKVPDNAGAVVDLTTLNDESNYLVVRDFNFAIPAGATIRGVTMTVVRKGEVVEEMRDKEVRLIVNSQPSGSDLAKNDDWPRQAFGTATYGGTTSLWSLPLTPAIVNNAGFGAGVKAKNHDVTTGQAVIDSIQLNITYCE